MKNKFNGYKEYISSLLISFLIALLISITVFTAIYLCGEKIINEYVSSDSYIYNTQAAYITSFQKYVSDNKVSSNDFKSIEAWIQREKPEFFLISIDNETHYVSTEFLCLKKPQNLSLYNQKISVYLKDLNFNDRTAKIFIYNNYQEKYLKTLLICDALFTLITAIMILFFIFRHILTQIHGTLNVVEQSETELINEKNMLIRSMAHDIRTPLAGLQSYAEIIKMENKKGAIPTEHIDVIFNKICEIKGLTDQLFDYSLACNEEALELDAPCNMESAIGDYLSEMAFILRENSFSLDIEKLIWKDFKITVNSNFLGRIFNNITNNICKYADNKAPVCISSIYRSKDAGIEITNHIADKSSLFNTTGMGIRNITLMMKQMNGRAIVSHNNTEFRITLWFSRA